MSVKNKWFKKMHRLYCKRKLATPYHHLFRYYIEVDRNLPFSGYRGHRDYFALLKLDELTGEAVNDLHTALPEHLFDNYIAAYEVFNSLGDDPDYEIVETAFDKYDDYASDHSEEIADILCNYYDSLSC